MYVPSRLSALTRLIHLASFAVSSFFPMVAQARWKPDLVINVVPTLFCSPAALLTARLARARSALDIQDYEVDALFGLGMAQDKGRLQRLALGCERTLLRAFDRVSTISPGMLKRAADKGVDTDKLIFFPNWSELNRFRDIAPDPQYLAQLGVPPGKRVLLYSGNLGEKQGLEYVIEAAEALQSDDSLFFLIVGDGGGKAWLMDLVNTKSLHNIAFAPLQPYENLPVLLASADVHLVVQRRGAADAVLPSKLTNILAVGGNAIITADLDTSLGMLVADYPGIATLVEPESVGALVGGIERAVGVVGVNEVAVGYAGEFLDKEGVLGRYLGEVG